jgi:uroporphyrinogen-III synthase
MSPSAAPSVVLLSAPGTLEDVDPLLRKEGIRLIRIPSLVPRPIAPMIWLRRIPPTARRETVIVTSRTAVTAGVTPWLRTLKRGFRAPEFWASGPGTAKALRAIGARWVRLPRVVGASGMGSAIGSRPRRSILYFRSDRASPRLARELRKLGHRVTDVIVYRLGAAPPLGSKARQELLRADLVIATSPSSMAALRRGIDSSSFLRLRRSARLVVLGERSRRAARGHGFHRVSVAPSVTAQRFTRYLLRELRNAPT